MVSSDKQTVSPVKINGEWYYTIEQFAIMTNKAYVTIRRLMLTGNRIRKLKFTRISGKPFIFASELTEFPFTVSGRTLVVYHYDEKGNMLK